MGCFEPNVPSPTGTGADYLQLIGAFAQGQPTLSYTESAWKPSYINTALSGVNQSLAGTPGGAPGLLSDVAGAAPTAAALNTYGTASNVGNVAELGPAAAAAVRNLNPGQSALYDQLTKTVSTDLAAGSQVDPATANRITTQVRGDWASRGLGTSAPAQLDEALQFFGSGQNLLTQREQAAQGAVQTGNTLTAPALALTTSNAGIPGQATDLVSAGANFGSQAGPTLIPGSTAYDTFNTAYNARAAAQIAGANNQAAILGSALSY